MSVCLYAWQYHSELCRHGAMPLFADVHRVTYPEPLGQQLPWTTLLAQAGWHGGCSALAAAPCTAKFWSWGPEPQPSTVAFHLWPQHPPSCTPYPVKYKVSWFLRMTGQKVVSQLYFKAGLIISKIKINQFNANLTECHSWILPSKSLHAFSFTINLCNVFWPAG